MDPRGALRRTAPLVVPAAMLCGLVACSGPTEAVTPGPAPAAPAGTRPTCAPETAEASGSGPAAAGAATGNDPFTGEGARPVPGPGLSTPGAPPAPISRTVAAPPDPDEHVAARQPDGKDAGPVPSPKPIQSSSATADGPSAPPPGRTAEHGAVEPCVPEPPL